MTRVVGLLMLGLLCACRAAPVPVAPSPSPYFDMVGSKLELGGEVFLYADFDGDAELAFDLLLDVLRQDPGLGSLAEESRAHGASLARVVGLGSLKAIGLSSVVDGDRYRNRGFAYVPKRRGIFDVPGGEAREFWMPAIAPSQSDLVWEQQVDANALFSMLRELAELGIGSPPGELDKWLDAPLWTLDVTPRDLFEGLESTVGIIASVDESRNVWLPGQRFTFPFTDFVIVVDGVADLTSSVARYARREPFLRAQRADGWTIVSPSVRLPPPWDAYEPALMTDDASGRTYLVSSRSFLQQCLQSGGSLAANATFESTSSDLPKTGNGFLYVSPRLTRVMHAALDKVVAVRGPAMQTHVARALLPTAGEPYAWVLRNEPDGLLFRSNSASSHKSTLLTFGFAAAVPALILLSPFEPKQVGEPL